LSERRANWMSSPTSRNIRRPHAAAAPSMAYDASFRICDQSTKTEAGRTSVRVDEDRRAAAQAPPSRHATGELDLHLPRSGVQPGPVAHAAREARVMANCREGTSQ